MSHAKYLPISIRSELKKQFEAVHTEEHGEVDCLLVWDPLKKNYVLQILSDTAGLAPPVSAEVEDFGALPLLAGPSRESAPPVPMEPPTTIDPASLTIDPKNLTVNPSLLNKAPPRKAVARGGKAANGGRAPNGGKAGGGKVAGAAKGRAAAKGTPAQTAAAEASSRQPGRTAQKGAPTPRVAAKSAPAAKIAAMDLANIDFGVSVSESESDNSDNSDDAYAPPVPVKPPIPARTTNGKKTTPVTVSMALDNLSDTDSSDESTDSSDSDMDQLASSINASLQHPTGDRHPSLASKMPKSQYASKMPRPGALAGGHNRGGSLSMMHQADDDVPDSDEED